MFARSTIDPSVGTAGPSVGQSVGTSASIRKRPFSWSVGRYMPSVGRFNKSIGWSTGQCSCRMCTDGRQIAISGPLGQREEVKTERGINERAGPSPQRLTASSVTARAKKDDVNYRKRQRNDKNNNEKLQHRNQTKNNRSCANTLPISACV